MGQQAVTTAEAPSLVDAQEKGRGGEMFRNARMDKNAYKSDSI